MGYVHAHYCSACRGYSPCQDYRPLLDDVSCLLSDPCVACGRSLAGVPAVSFLACDHGGTRCAAVTCPNPDELGYVN
jgi:hypothetical protein